MAQRTISVPQRSGSLSDPILFETINRIVGGVNSALTMAMAPSQPGPPSGVFTPSNPVARITSPGTIRTIGAVDFGCPLFLIAAGGDITLETGGNIAAGVTVAQGQCCGLIYDATSGTWWPLAGASSTAIATAIAASTVVATDAATTAAIEATSLTVKEADGSPILTDVTTLSVSGGTVSSGGSGVATLTIPSSTFSLTVEESDGAPSVTDVSSIKFDGATVTDDGSGVVTVSVAPAAAGVTVGEFDGSPSVSSVTEIQFDGATVSDETGGVVKVVIPGGSLTVQESDTSPSVASVSTLSFDGATVTDDGGGAVTVTIAASVSPVLATEEFTATASQTDFVTAWPALADGVVYVTRDGVVAKASDYSVTPGSNTIIQFGTGLDAGVEVQVCYWRTAPTGASPYAEGFVATAGQTDFTLAQSPTVVVVVSTNGVVQKTTEWSVINGDTLQFVTGLNVDDDVWISYLY